MKEDKENRGSQSGPQYYGSKTASDRMLRGRSPWGLGGAVYLLVRLLIRVRSFVDVRSLMLSVGGRGMLSNAVHPCWIAQVPSRGVVVVAVIVRGYRQ